MTCKECLYYEVCEHFNNGDAAELAENAVETKCPIFKDGSRYIETPCKVGDTVYTVVFRSEYIHSAKVVGFHLGKFPTLNGQKRKEYLVCYSSCYLRHIDIAQIGKTAFFTREEAEKALAERRKND